jgi:hypothetical protein
MTSDYEFNHKLNKDDLRRFKLELRSARIVRLQKGISKEWLNLDHAFIGDVIWASHSWERENIRKAISCGTFNLEQPNILEYLREKLAIENPIISDSIIYDKFKGYSEKGDEQFEHVIFEATTDWINMHPSVAHHYSLHAIIENGFYIGNRSTYSYSYVKMIRNIKNHIDNNSIFGNPDILRLFCRELMLHNPYVIERIRLEYKRLMSLNAVLTPIQHIIFRSDFNWIRRKNFMNFLIGSSFQQLVAKKL